MAVELRGMKTSSEHPGSSFGGYPVLALIALLLVLAAWNIAGNMPLHERLGRQADLRRPADPADTGARLPGGFS